MRIRYRRRRFSSSLQEIWQLGDIHWPMNEVARIHHCLYPSIDNQDLRCGRGSSRPWQASIAMADLGQPEQIGTLFAGFQNDLYVPQRPAGSPDQPPNQRPDQVADSA